jgi:hypothetical protein
MELAGESEAELPKSMKELKMALPPFVIKQMAAELGENLHH